MVVPEEEANKEKAATASLPSTPIPTHQPHAPNFYKEKQFCLELFNPMGLGSPWRDV
jgi:hypothetical protein